MPRRVISGIWKRCVLGGCPGEKGRQREGPTASLDAGGQGGRLARKVGAKPPPKAEPQEWREMRRRAPAAGWPRRDSSARDTHRPPSGCRAGTSWPARLLCQPSPGRPIPGTPGRGPAPARRAGRAGPRGGAWSLREASGAPRRGLPESAFSPRRRAQDPELGGAPPPPPPLLRPPPRRGFICKPGRAGGWSWGLLRRGPERSDVSLWREPLGPRSPKTTRLPAQGSKGGMYPAHLSLSRVDPPASPHWTPFHPRRGRSNTV